jgi:hypothetical protein
MCRAYDRVMTPGINQAFPGDRYPGVIPDPHCRPAKEPVVEAAVTRGPFLGGQFMVFDDERAVSARLVLRTLAGLSRTSIVLWARDHDDPGCLRGDHHVFEDARLERTAAGSHVLVVRLLHKDVRWGIPDSFGPAVTVEEEAFACSVDSQGSAACDGPLVTAKAESSSLPSGFNPSETRFFEIDPATTQWTFRRAPLLGPAGDLRVAP